MNEKNLTFDDASRVMFSSQMPETPEMYISYRESPDFVESQKNQ